MLYVKNELGNFSVAVGSPGSPARTKEVYPQTLDECLKAYNNGKDPASICKAKGLSIDEINAIIVACHHYKSILV